MTAQLEVTCSVCLVLFVEVRSRPARHGFSIWTQGFGHGHQGAQHSAPCFGWRYAPLEDSCEGTKEALRQVRDRLTQLATALEEHELRPTLLYNRARGSWKKPDMVKLAPGAERDYTAGTPSYQDQWDRVKKSLEGQRDEFRSWEKRYVKVIAEWKLATKKTLAEESKKGLAVHLQGSFKNRGQTPVPACRVWGLSPARGVYAQQPEEVTCTRCLKIVAERSKKAATATENGKTT